MAAFKQVHVRLGRPFRFRNPGAAADAKPLRVMLGNLLVLQRC